MNTLQTVLGLHSVLILSIYLNLRQDKLLTTMLAKEIPFFVTKYAKLI